MNADDVMFHTTIISRSLIVLSSGFQSVCEFLVLIVFTCAPSIIMPFFSFYCVL